LQPVAPRDLTLLLPPPTPPSSNHGKVNGFRHVLHTHVCVTIVCMQVDRLSITMDPDLGKSVRDAAARSGSSVSAWLAAAAADRLRNELLGAALDAWEAESTPFSNKELDAAARVLGVSRHARGSVA